MATLIAIPLSASLAAVAVAAWRLAHCGTLRDFVILIGVLAAPLAGLLIAGASV